MIYHRVHYGCVLFSCTERCGVTKSTPPTGMVSAERPSVSEQSSRMFCSSLGTLRHPKNSNKYGTIPYHHWAATHPDDLLGMETSSQPPISVKSLMSKVDAVADDAEESSVEALLRQSASSDLDTSLDVSHEEPTDDKPRAVRVKFEGMLPPSPPPGLDVENMSRTELLERLDAVQDKLTRAQVDLKNEKGVRRRKEKNIVKLATELGRRQVEASQKEQDIIKVSFRNLCTRTSTLASLFHARRLTIHTLFQPKADGLA